MSILKMYKDNTSDTLNTHRMMLKSVVFVCCIVWVLSAPLEQPQARILEYEFQPNAGDGSYNYKYETSNGISRGETGTVKLDKDNKEYIAVKGFYSYDSDKGRITVYYTADEDGYKENVEDGKSNSLRPASDLLSTIPPPLYFPAAALGSLVGGGLGK